MNIGFIGLGNMANAMIGGMLSKEIAAPGHILGADAKKAVCRQMEETYGIKAFDCNRPVAEGSDVLILAVKPQYLEQVAGEIKEFIREDVLIISIAAGKDLKWLGTALGEGHKIVRALPNTPALVGAGCSGVCRNNQVTDEEMDTALQIMGSFGFADEVPEQMMDAVLAVSSAAPAYLFMVIEAMADGAVAAGMPRQQAYEFASRTVAGSGELVLKTGKHPGELKDMVCSPGGVTIQGVKVLEKNGLRNALLEAMEACINKSKQL